MRRFTVSMSLTIIAVLMLALPVAAGYRWCASDPIVTLNGAPVQIWVEIPDEFVAVVNGPIDVKVLTPLGVVPQVVFTDMGFNGYGERLQFSTNLLQTIALDGSFTAQIKITVPVDQAMLRDMGYSGKTI